jgi:hypothetical protein|nr:MAG TPA: hypothetical protein [Caudoviricetes sp.]
MKEKEALEIAKKSEDEKELETLVDNMDLSKKVRLEVAKRKDSTAYYAKLALTDKMFTEDDILYMLIDDKNKNVSERAFTALCERMKGAGIKDKDVREDFIEYVIDVAEKTKMKDRRITNYLLEKCLKATNYAIIRTELEKLLSKMNESHLLEASYIQLAQQTESQSQLQKLAESQFESVREVAKSRSLNEGLADIKKLFVVEKVTTLRINKRDVISKLKTLIAVFSKFRVFDDFNGLLEQALNGVEKQADRQYFLKLSNDIRFNIRGFDKDAIALLDSERLRDDLDDVLNLTSLLSGTSLPKDTLYKFE